MNDKTASTQPVSPVNADFVQSQIEQSLELYRSQFSLIAQVITVIVVGDITLAGYALSARSSGVLIIGALFPLMALYQLHRFNRMMLPAIYTAVSLEQKYGGRDTDWLTSTLMSTFLSPESVETMVKISAEPNRVERIEKLRRVKIRPMGGGKGFVRAGLVFVAIAQFIAPIILTLAFQWHLF